MKHKILVPLDGSSESEAVFPVLRLLASKQQVQLDLLRCFEPVATVYTMPELFLASDICPSDARLRELALAYLVKQQGQVDGIETAVEVACSSPAGAIISRSDQADLTVMASHGRSGLDGWLLGSVTTKVVRSSKKPVLVVAGAQAAHPKLETIMVALDGSEFSERALVEASRLALAFDSKLILYRAVPMVYSIMTPEIEMEEAHNYLDRLVHALPEAKIKKVVHRTDGSIDIAERATELDVDLIVMGSHGRTGPRRWFLGSVTERVLHEAGHSVLVIH